MTYMEITQLLTSRTTGSISVDGHMAIENGTHVQQMHQLI